MDKVGSVSAQCGVVYDGECAVCQTFYGWTSKKDSQGRLGFAAVQSEGLASAAPQVDRVRATNALAFVRPDGKVVYGARAMFLTMARLPGAWGVFGRVMAWPPLSLLAEPGYRLFARHRHRFAGLVAKR
jgi:predicted DCC family thiol-disulfide oxidoreductase YuxK